MRWEKLEDVPFDGVRYPCFFGKRPNGNWVGGPAIGPAICPRCHSSYFLHIELDNHSLIPCPVCNCAISVGAACDLWQALPARGSKSPQTPQQQSGVSPLWYALAIFVTAEIAKHGIEDTYQALKPKVRQFLKTDGRRIISEAWQHSEPARNRLLQHLNDLLDSEELLDEYLRNLMDYIRNFSQDDANSSSTKEPSTEESSANEEAPEDSPPPPPI